MTPERIAELRKALEGVTDPPYVLFVDDGVYELLPAMRPGSICSNIENEADARFFLTFNRSVVSELLDTVERLREADNPASVGLGMAVSATIVMQSFGNETIAREILHAAGFKSADDMRAKGVDDYDIKILAPCFEHRSFRSALTGGSND